MTVENPVPASDIAVPPAAAGDTAANAGHMIPKARLDEVLAQKKTLEGDMAAIADAVLADVPAHLHGLIPADLGPAARIKWFTAAKATGVFGGTSTVVPKTDTAPARTTPAPADLSSLPAFARMSRGYGTK
ncbi:hypothetical protein [Inquilinus sp. OTU3971]|uniref:hypothetical protein n=1 Tax=Inquilinus sp. OTU3971 TaxID=3043855 RepID=UPI00313DA300